jgi:SSS family solute:Na+ symporter
VDQANALIHSIPDKYLQKQITITAALRYMLPPGIKGLFCSTMVMGLLAGDCSHMHSWSSIFVQDVILPLRGRPLTTRQHLWLLRLSLIGVATFAFAFSLLWRQTQYIALWWQITSSIFISGAGAAIIGGLYWRKGGTGAAWAAVIAGSLLSFGGILLNQYWDGVRLHVHAALPAKFPLNGIEVAFIAALVASIVYVVVSELTCTIPFDLDRLLHRGQYAGSDDRVNRAPRRSMLARLANIDESFTRRDRIIAMTLILSTLAIAAVNAIVCGLNVFAGRWSAATWSRFWLIFGVVVPFIIGAATFIWFTIGGIRDTRDFFRALRTLKRDANDDGRVAVSGEEAKRARASLPSSRSIEPSGTGDERPSLTNLKL